MRGAIRPLPHYAFMAWCSVEAQDNFTLPYLTLPYRSAIAVVPKRYIDVK
jgi:hypothetical protein